MEANSLLTAEPIEKVRFKRGCRAVYDADGKLLCGIHKKAIYDLNGNKIADYDRTETREEVRKAKPSDTKFCIMRAKTPLSARKTAICTEARSSSANRPQG